MENLIDKMTDNIKPVAVDTKNARKQLTVTINENINVLDEIYDEWSDLARRSNQPICMSPDWIKSWWKHLGTHKHRQPFIITVYDEDNLVAVLPFYRGTTSLAGRVIDQRLQILGSGGNPNEQLGFTDDYGISDFLDFVVDPEYHEQIANLFIKLSKSAGLKNHRIIFHQVNDESFIKKHLYPKLLKTEFQIQAEHTDTCPYVDLTEVDSLKGYIKQCKSNARRRFRQSLRAQNSDSEYIVEDLTTPDDIPEMVSTLITLHQQRWNEIGYPGAFYDERFKGFFSEIVYNAYLNNRLWFKQARDSSGVCASRMLLCYNGRYFDYMTGFSNNSPSAKYRPGIGLLLNAIEDSIENSAKRVELLRGDEGYKSDFTKKQTKNWKITIPPQDSGRADNVMPAFLIHSCSKLYKNIMCEITLMKIQYRQNGFLKMMGGYLQFRTQSIKQKLLSR